jgi:hypothetical protein
LFSVTLLNVSPPPENVFCPPVCIREEVFALNVKPVTVAKLNVAAVIVLAPSVRVRVFELLDAKVPVVVTVCPFVFKVPLVRVLPPVPNKESWSIQTPPTPFHVIAFAIEIPLNVIVLPELVEVNVYAPVCVLVIPEPIVRDPATLIAEFPPDPANVPVNPVKLRDRQSTPPETLTVTVTAPLFASKNTSSEEVGTASPPAPPEVAAHLEPAVASQFAVPPTQYLLAIKLFFLSRSYTLPFIQRIGGIVDKAQS